MRSGKGSHLLLRHPTSGKEVWVTIHTKKDARRLGKRILREAGGFLVELRVLINRTSVSGTVDAINAAHFSGQCRNNGLILGRASR